MPSYTVHVPGVNEQLPAIQRQLQALTEGQAKLSHDIAALKAGQLSATPLSETTPERSQAEQQAASNSTAAATGPTSATGAAAGNSPGAGTSGAPVGSPAAGSLGAGSGPVNGLSQGSTVADGEASNFTQRLDALSTEVCWHLKLITQMSTTTGSLLCLLDQVLRPRHAHSNMHTHPASGLCACSMAVPEVKSTLCRGVTFDMCIAVQVAQLKSTVGGMGSQPSSSKPGASFASPNPTTATAAGSEKPAAAGPSGMKAGAGDPQSHPSAGSGGQSGAEAISDPQRR